MNRMFAIVEREMRKFFRSPMLMIMSLMMPIMQLLIMGNAFGGKIVGAHVAVVDMDHGPEAVKLREGFDSIAVNIKNFTTVEYIDEALAFVAQVLLGLFAVGDVAGHHDEAARLVWRRRLTGDREFEPAIAVGELEQNDAAVIGAVLAGRVQCIAQGCRGAFGENVEGAAPEQFIPWSRE